MSSQGAALASPKTEGLEVSRRRKLASLLKKFERVVPRRMYRIRRALRRQDRAELEIELLKLGCALPPLGPSLRKFVPPSRELNEQEWEDTRQLMSHLEEMLNRLQIEMEAILLSGS